MGVTPSRQRWAFAGIGLALACCISLAASPAKAGGEAGPISLRDQGYFWVGVNRTPVDVPGPDGQLVKATAIEGQMYVAFQFPKKKRHPYPLVLIHGGGGQSTVWMGTPDGRDGWLDYFLAAGFDVYVVDRPAHGRSPVMPGYQVPGTLWTTQVMANLFTARSRQYPGGGGADTPEVAEMTASTEPGPYASDATARDGMAELLDRIGPAILITHSAGGPTAWLAMEARPAQVKAVLGIEPLMGITEQLAPLIRFSPALTPGETIAMEQRPAEAEGLDPCQLQPEASVRKVPAYDGKKILLVVSPLSLFTAGAHCSVEQLNQLGADAKLARLTDYGFEGNGHMMNDELNNGEIARKLLIPWLAGIK